MLFLRLMIAGLFVVPSIGSDAFAESSRQFAGGGCLLQHQLLGADGLWRSIRPDKIHCRSPKSTVWHSPAYNRPQIPA
jgi:hypothetical protein